MDIRDMQIPLGIQSSLDNIFAAIITGGLNKESEEDIKIYNEKLKVNKVCLPRFIANFPYNIFRDNNAIFYDIIVNMQVKSFTKDQLISVINNNRDLILDSPYINKANYTVTVDGNIASDDDVVNAITADLIDTFNTLSRITVSEDEFTSSCNIYIDWYKDELARNMALGMTAIMSDTGYDAKLPGKRARHYSGLDDMLSFYNENLKIIRSLSSDNRITSFVVDDKWLNNEIEKEKKNDTNSLFDTGIEEIDNVQGKLRRGNILGIMGPPKGGKTRFTCYLAARAAFEFGLNVCIWPLEGTSDEWLSMLEACYIAGASYKNSQKTGSKEIVRISSKDIIERKYTNAPTIRQYVIGAKTVMAGSANNNCGKISFIEGTAYVEDFLDVIESHWENENQFDVLIIDQLINVMSRTGKGKVERISEAYMNIKDLLANRLKIPAIGLMPAQLKQDIVDYLRKNPEETIDVTAGGESAETIRTPDYTIGLFSSKEERDNNIMKIYSVASRHSATFQDFQCKCYLECCYFRSNNE